MSEVESSSVDLVATSPPYPMIEMWDSIFSLLNPDIRIALDAGDGPLAFELMHEQLDSAWQEIFRALKPGGFACINIGDATRTMNKNFVLYPNHMRILKFAFDAGFSVLPCILWRKQTNAPNKFMGSGMLPAGAYVTLEHEYILILRKGRKRAFKSEQDKKRRRESAIFWEERNVWYSDVWFDIKGSRQTLNNKASGMRSGAYPFELVYRLINMYSVKNDLVLDPFLGTGTTTTAAIASGRNSVGYEIDSKLQNIISRSVKSAPDYGNEYIFKRIQEHFDFLKSRIEQKRPLKYLNQHYKFPVVTSQETELLFNSVNPLDQKNNGLFEVTYSDEPQDVVTGISNSLAAKPPSIFELYPNSTKRLKCRSKVRDKDQLRLFSQLL
jgi:DNA modification methylase